MDHRFKPNEIYEGVVTSVTDYGLFVEIAPNIEGLIHLSELDWVNKSPRPSNYAKVGDKIKVMVLKIEKEKCRLSLGHKQCESNPWQEYADQHSIGDIVEAQVKEVYDFGIFVKVGKNMDGFIHVNNLDWEIPGEEAIKEYRKGQKIQAKITYINVADEKVSLSIKKTKPNHLEDFMKKNRAGKAKVKCTVASIERTKVIVNLNKNLRGIIPRRELTNDRLKEPADLVKVGDELEALVLSYDKAKRTIALSPKAAERKEEREVLKQHEKKKSGFFATLGDILHLRGTEVKQESDETEEESAEMIKESNELKQAVGENNQEDAENIENIKDTTESKITVKKEEAVESKEDENQPIDKNKGEEKQGIKDD